MTGAGEGKIELEGSRLTTSMPSEVRVAVIVEHEFRVLMEGPGRSTSASARDVCIGICLTAALSAVSIWASVDFSRHDGNGVVPAWGPITAFGLMVVVALGTLIGWIFLSNSNEGRDGTGLVSAARLAALPNPVDHRRVLGIGGAGPAATHR